MVIGNVLYLFVYMYFVNFMRLSGANENIFARYFGTDKKYKPTTNTVIKSFMAVSSIRCAIECYKLSECRTFNYDKIDSNCELYSTIALGYLEFEMSQGSKTYEKVKCSI